MMPTLVEVLLFLLASSRLVRATCYDVAGVAVPAFVPCNPSLPVSTCCGGADYCLSNGLCFHAGGNNLLGQHGCTDPNWGAPCHEFCQKLQYREFANYS